MEKRIEYIDAMRGFTMLLIVYGHIRIFGYHQTDDSILNSYNSLLLLITLPLFFFISGWLFYKTAAQKTETFQFLIRKARKLLIPTVLFMFIYALLFNYNFIIGLFDVFKLGYWFTITLFNFFVGFYIIRKIFSFCRFSDSMKDYLWIIIALLLHFATTDKCMQFLGLYGKISNLFGIIQFKYFLFFIIGFLVKKHFNYFLTWKDKKYSAAILLIVFFGTILPILKYNPFPNNVWFDHFIFLYAGILGIFIIFLYFNRYQDSFTIHTKIGKLFQLIGKKTLDIYLLHYLFLPQNLEKVGNYFIGFINPCIEIFISIGLAFIVISLSLITSNIIRISPWLGECLLGEKNINQKDIKNT